MGPRKWVNRASTKDSTKMGRRGRDTVWLRKNHMPGVAFRVRRDLKGMELLRSKKFELHIRHPIPYPAKKRWAPKIPGFENQEGIYPEKLWNCRERKPHF